MAQVNVGSIPTGHLLERKVMIQIACPECNKIGNYLLEDDIGGHLDAVHCECGNRINIHTYSLFYSMARKLNELMYRLQCKLDSILKEK